MLSWGARICGWVFNIAGVAAEFIGGWPIMIGGIASLVSAWWALALEWGPITIIVALLTAVLAMIATDHGIWLVQRYRKASRREIELAVEIGELAEDGIKLAGEIGLKVDLTANEAGRLLAWRRRAKKALEEVEYEEYKGFETLPFPDSARKFRLIALRQIGKRKIRASEALAVKARLLEHAEQNNQTAI